MSEASALKLAATFAELISHVHDPSTLWPLMMEALERSVGFDAGYIAASWAESSDCRAAVLEHDPAYLEANIDRFLSEMSEAEVKTYAERAQDFEEVWPRERRKRLAVFNELLEPTGMRHMVVRVSYRHGHMAGVNLERRRASSAFTDHDRATIDVAIPFLHIAEQLTLATQDEDQMATFAARFALTRREAEFVTLACRGLQNGDIALACGLSANTVRNTLARVFEKAQVSNRVELRYLVTQCSVGQATQDTHTSRRPTSGFASIVEAAVRDTASQLALGSGPKAAAGNIRYTAASVGR
jgi:DNA-binding CsgD family transcriptional regulator